MTSAGATGTVTVYPKKDKGRKFFVESIIAEIFTFVESINLSYRLFGPGTLAIWGPNRSGT